MRALIDRWIPVDSLQRVLVGIFAVWAVIGLLLVTGVAAQTGAPVPVPGDGTPIPWWGQLLIGLAGTLGTVLTGLLGRALNALFDWLAAKTRLAMLAEVDEFIMGWVVDVYAAEVEAAKAAAEDGKLSDSEKAYFKQIPIDKAREHFGASKLGKLAGGAIEEFLGPRVERAVAAAQAMGAVKKTAKKSTSKPSGDPR